MILVSESLQIFHIIKISILNTTKNHFDYIIFEVLDKWFEKPKISHILGYDRSLVIEIANGKLEYKPHNESIVTLCSKSAIYLRAYPKSSLQFLSIWYNRFIRQS